MWYLIMTLGNNIRNIRKSSGLSQQQLAEKMCVNQQAVSKWEHGLSIMQLDRIKEFTDVCSTSVGAVLFDNEDVLRYNIPVDITEKIKLQVAELENKEELSFVENLELGWMKDRLKKGSWIISYSFTEYEYNLFKAIRHIAPKYTIEEFSEQFDDIVWKNRLQLVKKKLREPD